MFPFQQPISLFLFLVLFVSCYENEATKTEIYAENLFIYDTLVCNTEDVFTITGDTIQLTFMGKENLGMLLKLFKNDEFLFQDTLFPSGIGHLNLWETEVIKSDLSILCNKKTFNLFVLNEDMLLTIGYFESLLYFNHPKEGWKAFEFHLYPGYISRYVKTHVFQDVQKISFVGENWDLTGNPYKGDSLVVSYENHVFAIESYYPKSKLPGVEYFE